MDCRKAHLQTFYKIYKLQKRLASLKRQRQRLIFPTDERIVGLTGELIDNTRIVLPSSFKQIPTTQLIS